MVNDSLRPVGAVDLTALVCGAGAALPSRKEFVRATEDQELSGDPVLPGFRAPVARIFAKMKDKTPKSGRRRKKS